MLTVHVVAMVLSSFFHPIAEEIVYKCLLEAATLYYTNLVLLHKPCMFSQNRQQLTEGGNLPVVTF